MKLASFFEKCGSCSMLSVLVGMSTILITISLFLFGYSIYNKGDIDNARFEFEKLKREYESVLSDLKKLQDITPDQYEAESRLSYVAASHDIGIFRNIFIASAILTTRNGSHAEAIVAWKKALHVNPDAQICHYALGREYLKVAALHSGEPAEQKALLYEAVRHLQPELLRGSSHAQYQLALAHLRLAECEDQAQEKYAHARKAIAILQYTDASKQDLGDVDSNMALGLCLAARNAPDAALSADYRQQAATYFSRIKGLPHLEVFYNKYHNSCLQP